LKKELLDKLEEYRWEEGCGIFFGGVWLEVFFVLFHIE